MNRTKRFLINIIFSVLSQVVIMASGFIIPKMMLRFYGSEINGLIASITQIMSYISLIEGGLAGAAVFALYKPLAENDNRKISGIIVATKKLYYKIGYIALSATLLISLCYPLLIKTNLLSYWEIVFLFLIIAFTTIFDYFILAKYRALLSADQKEYIISISTSVQYLINTSVVVILSYQKVNIVIVRLVALSSIFFRLLVIYIYAKRKYKYIDMKASPLTNELDKRWDALFLQLLNAIHRGSPIIIATLILSLNDVSIYSIYNLVLNGVASILAIFMNGLQAAFGDVIARKQDDTLSRAYNEFELCYLALITVLYSITFLTIMPFIKVYAGHEDINYFYPVLGVLFTINGFLYSIKNPQGMIVISAGMYKETKYQSLTQGLLCVVIGVLLCFPFGLVGILIGRICSNVYRDIDLLLFVPKKMKSISLKCSLKKWMVYILTFILIVIIGNLINYVIRLDSIVKGYGGWIIYAVIIGIMSLFITILVTIIFYKKDIVSIMNRFKKKTSNVSNVSK